jgi:hypothetical protein
MAPDGADHEIIEDNVIAADAGGYPFAVTLYSDNGSVLRHNTFADGACSFNLRCGIVRIGSKDSCSWANECDPGVGTIVKDNVMGEYSVGGGSATSAANTNNLFRTMSAGTANIQGLPTFAGGGQPTTYEGYALAAGSLGWGNASDGLNRGIRIGATTPPPPAPAPDPAPAPAPPPPPAPAPDPAPAPAPPPPPAPAPAPAPAPPPPPAPAPAPAPDPAPVPAPAPDPAPATGGLVAAFGFAESTGTKITDSSGRANHGTTAGATRTTSGKYGRALSFDGVNDYASVPDTASLDLTKGMTLEAWVYPTAGGSAWRTALLKETSAGLSYGLYAFDGGGHSAGFLNSGSDIGASSTTALPLSKWSHLAATYDGAALKLYVNGALKSTRTATGAMPTSTKPLKIGGNAVWGEFFKGSIDDVRVYSRALSATELKADMGKSV